MTTFGELKAQVLFNAFDAKYDAEAGRRLNQAARQIAGRALWNRTLQPGVVGSDGLVVLPVEFVKVTAVWKMAPSWQPSADAWSTIHDALAQQIPSVDASGMLAGWAQNALYSVDTTTGGAQRIRVVGLQPGDRVAVEGPQLPAPMEGDDTDSPLGEDADDALVLFARAKLYLREDDPEMHAALLGEFERELKTFVQRAAPEPEGPVQVRGMWDGVL